MPNPFLLPHGPYNAAFTITPSDTSSFTQGMARAFMAGVAGNVSLVDLQGNTTIVPVSAGVIYPIASTRINATNTTATGLVGLQ